MFEKIEDVPSKLLGYYFESAEVNKLFDEDGAPLMTTVPTTVTDEDGNSITIQRPVQKTEEVREVTENDRGQVLAPALWWEMAKGRKGQADDILKSAVERVNNYFKWVYHDEYLEWYNTRLAILTEISTLDGIVDTELQERKRNSLYGQLEAHDLTEPVLRAAVTPEQWFINFAEELREIAESNYDFVLMASEDTVNHTTTVQDTKSTIILKYPTQEMLNDKSLVITQRLDDLKRLRNNALAKGFTFKGNLIISDRDAQGDVHRIYDQYKNGIKAAADPTMYKVSANAYMRFENQDEVLELLKAMTLFVEQECFGKEAAVAQQLVDMEIEELLTLDLTTLFTPDHTTEKSV